MKFKVEPNNDFFEVDVPGSKSETNRALILAAIAGKNFRIRSPSNSVDSLKLKSLLQELGIRITDSCGDWIVERSIESLPPNLKINFFTGDGGTTTRFFMALLSRIDGQFEITLSDQMAIRPLDDLLTALTTFEIQVVREDNKIFMDTRHRLLPSSIEVSAALSSQFASGLMLAYADLSVQIRVQSLNTSRGHYLLTEKMVKAFREGLQEFQISPDAASSSYPIALGLVRGNVLLKNLAFADFRGPERDILTLAMKSGGDFEEHEDGILAHPSMLRPIDVNCSQFPDLVPTLAFLATRASGNSLLRGVNILKVKESDRLLEIEKLLIATGSKYQIADGDIFIEGDQSTKAPFFEYHAPHDHRMAMTAYLFMKCHSGGVIYNSECVEKSFPNFFSQLK